MSDENEDESHQAGHGPGRGGTSGKKDKGPIVVQKVSPVRPSYSYPGSVAKPDVYSKFRFITEEMMEQVICEAQENLAKKKSGTKGKSKCSALGGPGGFLENEVSKAQYDKWVKQIKWFWLEIEDYLREIETVYNEVRLHASSFAARRKDKEEEVRRNKRISEFNARSCRIVYDLQQQTKDCFSYLESNRYVLNRATMKKLHGIHRGVVMALHNLLTRLPDYELDRGLPPVYHQLAMLIRRLAQCCYKLNVGQDVHIIRNLEGIRQKVEDASHEVQQQQEMPLYKMTPTAKKPHKCTPWDSKRNKTCPVVWQEYEAHAKGKKPATKVPNKLLEMVDLSKRGGFIAPVQLQSGLDKFLRMKSPAYKGEPPAIAGKLTKAMGKSTKMTDDEFDSMANRFKKLQQDFISEVEGQISARLKPLLQEAKRVAEAKEKEKKKTVTVGHVKLDQPKDPIMKQKINELLSQYTGATKLEHDYVPPAIKETPRPGPEGWGDYLPEHQEAELPSFTPKKKNRSRSPTTIRQRSDNKLNQFKSLANVSPIADKAAKLKQTQSAGLKTVKRSQPIARTGTGISKTMLPSTAEGDHKAVRKSSKGTTGLKTTKSSTKSQSKSDHGKDAVVYAVQGDEPSTSKERGEEEVKWSMKGDISMWSSNQVDDMLNRLNQMESEEKSIRSRWQDLLYVDPSANNESFRISYGEKPSLVDSKEPDAILLMKPSVKKDTVIVVGAMAEDKMTESQITISRARAGVDASTNPMSKAFTGVYKESIKMYRDKFDEYLQRTSHYAVGSFDPWKVVMDVADNLLNDLFHEVSTEIADIPDNCVQEMYDAEFARS